MKLQIDEIVFWSQVYVASSSNPIILNGVIVNSPAFAADQAVLELKARIDKAQPFTSSGAQPMPSEDTGVKYSGPTNESN